MKKYLAGFFRLPVFTDDEELTLRARVLVSVLRQIIGVVFLVGLMGYFVLFDEKLITSLVCFGVVSIALVCIGLVRARKVWTAGIITSVVNLMATLALVLVSGGLRSIHGMLFLTGTVLAGLIFGSLGAMIYAAASLVFGFGILVFQLTGGILPELFTFKPVVSFIILATNLGLIIIPLNVVLKHLREALKKARNELAEKKQIEAQLRKSESRIRDFVEQSNDGIWMLGFDQPIPIDLPAEEQVRRIHQTGTIEECNDAIARMYGYSKSKELLGTRLLKLYGPSYSEVNFQSTLKLVHDGYRSANRETYELDRDGKRVVFLNNAIGMIQEGNLVAIWGTQRDVTHLKQTQQALLVSEARMRALLEAVPDMIFEIDRDGRIIDFVPAQDERPYIRVDQFMGQSLDEVLPPSIAVPSMTAIQSALDGGQMQAIQYEMQTQGLVSTYEARITPAGSDRVLCIIRNITDRIQAEREREKLISELENKNAELERFTYTVSHDLKSPLITIRGFLGYLERDALAGNLERIKTDAERISRATDKMQRLLNDLLELSRIGRVMSPPQAAPFERIVLEASELIQGRLEQCGMKVVISSDLPQVYGDRERLVEVVQNLLDNAAKFFGDQPSPTVWIACDGEDEGHMRVFSITDNGLGIEPKYHESIFGLFNKLDANSEGTGVGLALVKRIIEVHGGRVWVESEGPGKGSKFSFTLPGPPEK